MLIKYCHSAELQLFSTELQISRYCKETGVTKLWHQGHNKHKRLISI
jgi:hypothetical protein